MRVAISNRPQTLAPSPRSTVQPGVPLVEVGIVGWDGAILDDPHGFVADYSLAIRLNLIEIGRSNPRATSYEVVSAEERDGAVTVVAVAPLDHAKGWLSPPARLVRAQSGVAICRLAPAGVRIRLERFGDAFGLSPAVIRTVIALYEQSDVKAAAKAAKVSFNTAREYLAQARAAIWAPNLPRLITWAGVGSLGLDASGESDHGMGELFSLSVTQRRLAGLVADGASRKEAALVLGISEALAKKQLAAVFAATGVSSAIGLARLFADLRGLAVVAGEIPTPEPYPPPFSRTLVVEDGRGRRIVASDYGPAGGRPVIILHNTMNCRGVDRALVAALQDRGYRPISPDRPGYGDTDPASADCHGEAYLQRCADDVAALCEQMRWSRVAVIAHGPVHVVLALLRAYPDLIEKVVIDAPEPDSASGEKAVGMIPNLKRQFARRPWAVASVFRVITALASYQRIAGIMREWTSASPADKAAMDDPALMMDFYRKLIPFREGRIDGLVREQVIQATSGKPALQPNSQKLTFLIGATDFMHDATETHHYWRSVLPQARFDMIPDAGRFISYSHPHLLLDALKRPAAGGESA